jgi:hypothetical protein
MPCSRRRPGALCAGPRCAMTDEQADDLLGGILLPALALNLAKPEPDPCSSAPMKGTTP